MSIGKNSRRFPVGLKPHQLAFWERKKKELARQAVLNGLEDKISNSAMFQGLVELWMALDSKPLKRKR